VKDVLEPLALIPGVRLAGLISSDGVPIAVIDGVGRRNETPTERDPSDELDDLHAFAGIAAGWLGDVTRSVGQLAWAPPRRLVLHGTRGTLVLQHGPGAVVLVVLEQGVTAEELRVPMEGAIARIQRLLRTMGDANDPVPSAVVDPPGVLPAGADAAWNAADEQHLVARNHSSEIPGDN
jgi:predicted regulator of Ras-like GTPase activity (Roadblock/LC7/MglB family)